MNIQKPKNMKFANQTEKLFCVLTMLFVGLSSFGLSNNLRYYRKLNTRAERALKGEVKKVTTHKVDFAREWGDIKIKGKHPVDSIVYDSRGRVLYNWPASNFGDYYKGKYQKISWKDNEHSILYSFPGYNNSIKSSSITIKFKYEYDAQNRLASVTETWPDNKVCKVIFKYNPDGGYTSTVYKSIDALAESSSHSSINSTSDYFYCPYELPQYEDRYLDNYDSNFSDYRYKVENDSHGNWVKAERYDSDDNLIEMYVREIEYFDNNIGTAEETAIGTVNSDNDVDKIINAMERDSKYYEYEDNKVFTSVEQMPVYPGGDAALMKWVSDHIRYPSEAQQNGIQGRVVVKFVVAKDGSIGDVEVVRGIDPDLDNEARRVVKTLPKFTPGKMNGRPVNVWYTLPITFKL
ncbi:MAG: energy transducer TonB [Firmicutes bacterium]|nr:energy transducer TonB [Bacillota bacterium]MCM1401928.1 energy transducer TonB [Bacteroides sp.]MCM1476650.1 energy transducer TonB [Bacteroides sp.]